MLRTLSAIAVLVAVCCSEAAAGTRAYRLGGVTDTQVREISPIIHRSTSEHILGFRRRSDGIIEVETGDHGPQGTGGLFRLRKSHGTWKIVEKLLWTA